MGCNQELRLASMVAVGSTLDEGQSQLVRKKIKNDFNHSRLKPHSNPTQPRQNLKHKRR